MLSVFPASTLVLYIIVFMAMLLKFSLKIPIYNSIAWSKSLLLAAVYNAIIYITGDFDYTVAIINFFPMLVITYIATFIIFSEHYFSEEQRILDNNDSSYQIIKLPLALAFLIHIVFIFFYIIE